MSYRQYTSCVQFEDFNEHYVGDSIAAGLFVGVMELVIASLALGGISLVTGGIASFLAIVTGLASFCHWWLYGRLICLGDEVCAIGMVINVYPPKEKSGFERFDSDYCFDLLLAPNLIGVTQQQVETDGIQGNLIRNQYPGPHGLPFSGLAHSGNDCKDPASAILMCEIEGAGMHILYQYLKALLVVLGVAAVASWFCWVPIIGWIACLVAAVLLVGALITFVIGIIHGLSDAAGPSDVNPELGGTLTWGCAGMGADLLVVSGKWIYDSFHGGWNEIHPVRHCQKIGTWRGEWPFDVRGSLEEWCHAIKETYLPLTLDNQKIPENQWVIHPEIDGCASGDGERHTYVD